MPQQRNNHSLYMKISWSSTLAAPVQWRDVSTSDMHAVWYKINIEFMVEWQECKAWPWDKQEHQHKMLCCLSEGYTRHACLYISQIITDLLGYIGQQSNISCRFLCSCPHRSLYNVSSLSHSDVPSCSACKRMYTGIGLDNKLLFITAA